MTVSKKDVWDDHSLTQHNFRQRVKYFLRNTRRDRDEYSDTKGARDRQTGENVQRYLIQHVTATRTCSGVYLLI